VADEVSASACKQLLDALEGRGIGRSELLQGLSLSEEDLERPRGRIAWSHFVAILDRAAERLGGPEALEELGATHARRPVATWLPALARTVISPVELYWFGKWYGQSVFHNVRCNNQRVASNRIQQILTIPNHDPDCPGFFHLMRGVLATTPCLIGLSEARVHMELHPRRAIYTVHTPRPLSLPARLFRRLRFSGFALRQVVDELTPQHADLIDAYQQLSEANASIQEELERQRRSARDLEQAQRLEALGRLASGIAHDFNNVLSTIRVSADLASAHACDPEALEETLERIRNAADRAAGTTSKLLTFGRSQPVRREILDVNDSVTQMRDVLDRLIGAPVELETCLTSAPTQVEVDPTQLDQVILNLVLNARDALELSGRVSITTSIVPIDDADEAPAQQLSSGLYVCLEVSDDGCGIDEETQGRIFEPFFTTKPVGSGTGLGLSIVHGIVRQNGGNVTIDSKPGIGTTVSVYLPFVKGAREGELTEHVGWTGDVSGRPDTVVLAEDDEQLRWVVRTALEKAGFHVLEAASGAHALQVFREHGEGVDALITDVRMPGMSGPELVQKVRLLTEEVPVLYISGYTEEGSLGRVGNRQRLLGKPFSIEHLVRTLRELLREHSGAAS